MAVWAILAAPLLLSTELATVRPEHKAILQNVDIIAINQDPMGIQGKRVLQKGRVDIWTRPVTPVNQNEENSWAVALVSQRVDGVPYIFDVKLSEFGLDNEPGYIFEDLYDEEDSFILTPDDTLSVRINPLGVKFFKATALDAASVDINVLL